MKPIINYKPTLHPWDKFFNTYFFDEPQLWEDKKNKSNSFLPVNVIEEDDKFILEINAPGIKKNKVNINIDNNRLRLSYEKKEEKEEEKKNYIRKEFSHSSFERTFDLNDDINTEKISAKYEDGILRIILEKKMEKTAVQKSITVS